MLIRHTATRKLSVDDRTGIIGGSSVGALLELNGYGTEFEVYLEYIGRKPEPEFSPAGGGYFECGSSDSLQFLEIRLLVPLRSGYLDGASG